MRSSGLDAECRHLFGDYNARQRTGHPYGPGYLADLNGVCRSHGATRDPQAINAAIARELRGGPAPPLTYVPRSKADDSGILAEARGGVAAAQVVREELRNRATGSGAPDGASTDMQGFLNAAIDRELGRDGAAPDPAAALNAAIDEELRRQRGRSPADPGRRLASASPASPGGEIVAMPAPWIGRLATSLYAAGREFRTRWNATRPDGN